MLSRLQHERRPRARVAVAVKKVSSPVAGGCRWRPVGQTSIERVMSWTMDQEGAALDAGIFLDQGGDWLFGKGKIMRVKLNLRAFPPLERAQYGQEIVTAMGGVPLFRTANPTLASVQLLVTNALTKIAAHEAAKANVDMTLAERDAALAAMDAGLNGLGNYVQIVSNGDAVIIHSAHMDVRSPASPIGPMPPVDVLTVTMGDGEGRILVTWPTLRGADNYTVQQHADPLPANGNGNNGWTTIATVSRGRYLAQGLESGKKFWFRVAANGTQGTGPWSEPGGKMAP